LVDPLHIIDNSLRAKVGVDVSQSPIGIDQMIAAPTKNLEKIIDGFDRIADKNDTSSSGDARSPCRGGEIASGRPRTAKNEDCSRLIISTTHAWQQANISVLFDHLMAD
jgi:hypothetical protein